MPIDSKLRVRLCPNVHCQVSNVSSILTLEHYKEEVETDLQYVPVAAIPNKMDGISLKHYGESDFRHLTINLSKLGTRMGSINHFDKLTSKMRRQRSQDDPLQKIPRMTIPFNEQETSRNHFPQPNIARNTGRPLDS